MICFSMCCVFISWKTLASTIKILPHTLFITCCSSNHKPNFIHTTTFWLCICIYCVSSTGSYNSDRASTNLLQCKSTWGKDSLASPHSHIGDPAVPVAQYNIVSCNSILSIWNSNVMYFMPQNHCLQTFTRCIHRSWSLIVQFSWLASHLFREECLK